MNYGPDPEPPVATAPLSGHSQDMTTESQMREKLRKIEALFAGAGTAGERDAAEAALDRVRAKLGEMGRRET